MSSHSNEFPGWDVSGFSLKAPPLSSVWERENGERDLLTDGNVDSKGWGCFFPDSALHFA